MRSTRTSARSSRLARRPQGALLRARKRAAVAAGIGAYLYTSLKAVVLPDGPHAGHVQAIRRQGKSDLLVLSPETEQWLRHGCQTRMSTDAVRRDLGEILAHGEPENGSARARSQAEPPSPPPAARRGAGGPARDGYGEVVTVDLGDLGPAAADEPQRLTPAGGRGRPLRQSQRGAARGPDPDPAAAAAALRRPAAPAPLALELQLARPLPRGLAPHYMLGEKTAPSG